MLVNNKTLFVRTLPVQAADGAYRDTLTLMPGVNEVPQAKWDRVATKEKTSAPTADGKGKIVITGLTEVHQAIEEGTIVEMDNVPLSKRPQAEAVKIVKDTVSLELLEKWREDEKRPPVIEAIGKAIKAVTMTPEEEKKAKATK